MWNNAELEQPARWNLRLLDFLCSDVGFALAVLLPILVAAHRLVERGLLDLGRRVTVHEDFASQLPGHRFSLDPTEDSDPETWGAMGTEVPLGDRLRLHEVNGRVGAVAAPTRELPSQVQFHDVLPRGHALSQ